MGKKILSRMKDHGRRVIGLAMDATTKELEYAKKARQRVADTQRVVDAVAKSASILHEETKVPVSVGKMMMAAGLFLSVMEKPLAVDLDDDKPKARIDRDMMLNVLGFAFSDVLENIVKEAKAKATRAVRGKKKKKR